VNFPCPHKMPVARVDKKMITSDRIKGFFMTRPPLSALCAPYWAATLSCAVEEPGE
jgi:hypothetical protein